MIAHDLLPNVILLPIALMMLLAFPEFPLRLVQTLAERWTTYRATKLSARRERAKKRLSKYWEIDISRLR